MIVAIFKLFSFSLFYHEFVSKMNDFKKQVYLNSNILFYDISDDFQ